MQEEITQRTVSLSVEAGKMTADLLQKAVKKVLEEMQKKQHPVFLPFGSLAAWTTIFSTNSCKIHGVNSGISVYRSTTERNLSTLALFCSSASISPRRTAATS